MVEKPAAGRRSSEPLGPAACESDAKKLEFIEEMTANAGEVQAMVLAEILKRNAETEYLRRHGMGGATGRRAFRERIPIVSYEDLKPDIQRIADGDRSAILSAAPISEFLTRFFFFFDWKFAFFSICLVCFEFGKGKVLC